MGKGLTVTVAAAFAVAAFGFGVSVTTLLVPAEVTEDSHWRLPLALGLVLSGLVLVVIMLVRILRLRDRYLIAAWRGMSREHRRYASRQLRGEVPVGGQELEFLRALARQRRNQRVMALQQAGLTLVFSGQAVLMVSVWQLAIGLFLAALMLVSLAIVSKDVTNMITFLNRYGWASTQAV